MRESQQPINTIIMPNTIFEEFKVTGSHLLSRVKELIQKGNVRRIMIKDAKGKTLIETPLTFGVAGMGGLFLIAPFITAVAAIALVISDAKIVVERYENENIDENELTQDYIEIDIDDDDKDS